MEKIKPGKQRLPVIENKSVLAILSKILNNGKNSNQIAKELNKLQSGIYKQLVKLKEEGFVIQLENNDFIINYEKFIEEFIFLVYSKGEPAQVSSLTNKYSEKINNLSKNKYLIELIKTTLKYGSSDEGEHILPYLGLENKENITIKMLFEHIIQIFLITDITQTIERFFLDRYASNLNLTNNQTDNINQNDYPELYMFKEIIYDAKALWGDFDENLEEDIRNNICDIILEEEFKFID